MEAEPGPLSTFSEMSQLVPHTDRTTVFGVVFDLDDTLIDHAQWSVERFERVSIELGLDPATTESFLTACRAHLARRPWTSLLEDISHDSGIDLRVLRESYQRHGGSSCSVRACARECITDLRRSGVPVGVLTNNGSAEGVRRKLEALDVELDAVQAVWDAQKKPSPYGFEAIARDLALPPERLVMVGDDGLCDVLGAVRSGYLLAVHLPGAGGVHDRSFRAELEAHELERCVEVNSLDELGGVLRSAHLWLT